MKKHIMFPFFLAFFSCYLRFSFFFWYLTDKTSWSGQCLPLTNFKTCLLSTSAFRHSSLFALVRRSTQDKQKHPPSAFRELQSFEKNFRGCPGYFPEVHHGAYHRRLSMSQCPRFWKRPSSCPCAASGGASRRRRHGVASQRRQHIVDGSVAPTTGNSTYNYSCYGSDATPLMCLQRLSHSTGHRDVIAVAFTAS